MQPVSAGKIEQPLIVVVVAATVVAVESCSDSSSSGSGRRHCAEQCSCARSNMTVPPVCFARPKCVVGKPVLAIAFARKSVRIIAMLC